MKYFLLVLYAGFLALIFFGLPDSLLYTHEPQRWLPFILVFVVEPVLLYYVLKAFLKRQAFLLGWVTLSVEDKQKVFHSGNVKGKIGENRKECKNLRGQEAV